MIHHIIRLIWNQRKSNGWLVGELLLVSVCLWYIVDYFLVASVLFRMPLGFDIDHTYQFQFSAREEGAEGFLMPDQRDVPAGEDLWEVVERLRMDPSVESVAVSQYSIPYTEIINFVSLSSDTLSQGVRARVYSVTPDYFDVYRIRLADGKAGDLKNGLANQALVVTQDVMSRLTGEKPDEVSSVYVNNAYSASVGAVSEVARATEFGRVIPKVYFPITESEIKKFSADNLPWVEVSVRVKPAADVDFVSTFMQEKSERLEIGNLYLQNIIPVSSVRADRLREEQGRMNTRFCILFFLLANIFLGVVGTFWFRTRQRQGELGLRMALGSTRRQLRKVMFGEGLLILTFAFVPAIAVCANMVYADLIDTTAMDHTFFRFAGGVGITYLLMAGMIGAGIWYPAKEVSRLEPAVALHYE